MEMVWAIVKGLLKMTFKVALVALKFLLLFLEATLESESKSRCIYTSYSVEQLFHEGKLSLGEYMRHKD